jgi:hypothetical protein
MSRVRSQFSVLVPMAIVAALGLAGCASPQSPPPEIQAPPPQHYPAAYRAEEFVGRWGFASYHKPDDRPRTEAAAQGQCGQPYVIGLGPSGGVLMHLADQTQPQELRVKGGPGGKTYIGPDDEPGGMQDREVVSFDGRVLILRWIDPEVVGRYGTGVYVRCGAEGTKPRPKKPPAKPKPR